MHVNMSKKFILETEPKNYDKNTSVVKFIVKQKQSHFLKYIRTPLVTSLIAYIILLIYNDTWVSTELRFISIDEFPINKEKIAMYGVLVTVITALSLMQQKYDSIIVMKNFGVQLNSYGSWKYFGKSNDKNCFIPQKDIIDIVIHEGFQGFGQVVFYLCILTKSQYDESMVKIVFPNFLPRRELIEDVWRQSREILFGTSRRYWRRVPGQGLKECIAYTS